MSNNCKNQKKKHTKEELEIYKVIVEIIKIIINGIMNMFK